MGPEAMVAVVLSAVVLILGAAAGLVWLGWWTRDREAKAEADWLTSQRDRAKADLKAEQGARARDQAAAREQVEALRRRLRVDDLPPGDLDGALGMLFPASPGGGSSAPGGTAGRPGAGDPPPAARVGA